MFETFVFFTFIAAPIAIWRVYEPKPYGICDGGCCLYTCSGRDKV